MGEAFDSGRLQRLHEVMGGYVERGEIPGLVAVVARRGDVHVQTHGTLAVGGAQPVVDDTIFRISSMTKPVVAAAALLLVEECRLYLDEPVDGLLPELADRRVLRAIDAPLDDTVPANRPITLRDLLTFQSGLGMIFDGPGTYPIQTAMDELELGQGPPQPAHRAAPDEWMRRLGTLPLLHQPGESWRYNTGSDLLGVLIARASGQDLPTFLRERLFEPLGMVDTGFWTPPEKVERMTPAYELDAESGELTVYDPAAGGQWTEPPAFPSGAGGLVSTATDYLAFACMLLNRGKANGQRILSPAAVAAMTTPRLSPDQVDAGTPVLDASINWGYGVAVVTSDADFGPSIGSYGWAGGLGSFWDNDPSEDLVGIILTNVTWSSPAPLNAVRDFWTLTYAALTDWYDR